MRFWTWLKNKFRRKKKAEPIAVLEALPEITPQNLEKSSPLALMSANGPVCNVADWKTITKDVLVYVTIPIGFKRNADPLKIYISIDRSNLYLDKRIKKQRATINIQDEAGNPAGEIICNTEIIRMLVSGDLKLNTVLSGFEPIEPLDVEPPVGELKLTVTTDTAFSHLSHILFQDQAGYMCKECEENEPEIEIRLKVSNPIVTLPDGREVEGTLQGAGNEIVIIMSETPSEFDEFFNGETERIIQIPCQVLTDIAIETFS